MKRFPLTAVFLVGLSFHLCGRADNTSDMPIGLVLSGGGALGAYEVGVWETIVEMDLANRISVISGTSVGAINAALFASVQDPQACCSVWESEIGDAFQVNTNFIARLGSKEAAMVDCAYEKMEKNIHEDIELEARKQGIAPEEISPEKARDIRKKCERVAHTKLALKMPKLKAFLQMAADMSSDGKAEGPLSSDALQTMILRAMPETWPDKNPAVYATTIRKTMDNNKPKFEQAYFCLNDESHERKTDILCTSACIPFVFGAWDFDEAIYVDGGWEAKGGDNVPLKPILEKHPEIKTVIVVYLDDAERRHEKNEKSAASAGIDLVPIFPSKSLGGWGGVFNTSPETVRQRIDLGRKDARKALDSLVGHP